jgi:hypothetical protein
MKTTLFVFCLLATTCAFAQNGSSVAVLSAQPAVFEETGHPAHASFTPMASEMNIMGGTGYAVGQGDRPFWDFPQAPQISLGDAARELKKEHAQLVKKSRVVYTNQ